MVISVLAEAPVGVSGMPIPAIQIDEWAPMTSGPHAWDPAEPMIVSPEIDRELVIDFDLNAADGISPNFHEGGG